MRRRLIPATILLFVFAAAASAQQPDSTRTHTGKTITLSIVGSAAGIVGGGAAGFGLCKATGWGDSGEDPCLGHMILGGLAGSIAGSALGAHIARKDVAFSQALTGALGGAVLGFGAGYLIGKLVSSPGPILIGYSVTQGVVTGLLTTAKRPR